MVIGKCIWRIFNMFRILPPGNSLGLVNLITLRLFYLIFTGFLLVMFFFKIILLVFKSFNNLSPSYLADRPSYQSHSGNLRSSSRQLLEQPRSLTKTYGDRAFSVCAPKLWNSLELRKSTSLTSFKKGLKTYIFRKLLEGVFVKAFLNTCNFRWIGNWFLIYTLLLIIFGGCWQSRGHVDAPQC